MTETYWFGWVKTREDGKDGVSASCHGETLAEFLTDITRTGLYYLSLGYEVRAEDIQECCATCNGQGRFPRISRKTGRRLVGTVRCKDCHGKATFGKLPGFYFQVPRNVKVIGN